MQEITEKQQNNFHDYKKLKVWELAVELAVDIYQLSALFPHSEIYGLTSQIRRSAVSISSNIAEGAGRNSDKYFSQFLSIAYGSACELETQLHIANKLQFISKESFQPVLDKVNVVQKMIFKLNSSKNSGL